MQGASYNYLFIFSLSGKQMEIENQYEKQLNQYVRVASIGSNEINSMLSNVQSIQNRSKLMYKFACMGTPCWALVCRGSVLKVKT